MTREEAINVLKEIIDESWIFSDIEKAPTIDACEMAISALSAPSADVISIDQANAMIKSYVSHYEENKGEWTPLKTRPMTDEEREHYREWSDIEGAMIFDCQLPEDGQEVLISYGGYVCVDTFCKDDGCYFEGVDIDDVEAWMPLPEPYKAEKGGEE